MGQSHLKLSAQNLPIVNVYPWQSNWVTLTLLWNKKQSFFTFPQLLNKMHLLAKLIQKGQLEERAGDVCFHCTLTKLGIDQQILKSGSSHGWGQGVVTTTFHELSSS